jgi:UDP-N-acetylmuramate: L-alanyl-gamma-D-glutamyl-meso-diaminopimelate ligase
VGVKVKGSDKGFFPPVSTELEKQGVSFYAGWHIEKMTADGDPDVIIVGTASGSQNPETLYAIEKKIPMYSFAEAIGEFFAKENSIVCVGTWGKTSSSAMLSYILEQSDKNPTYMFGGVSLSHEASAKLTDSNISVFEGDEYKSSPTDNTAKFFYYRPSHLLLTAVSWDHADLYPTEKSYFDTFGKLMGKMPSKGFIVGCGDNLGVMKTLEYWKGKTILYGKDSKYEYSYSDIKQNENGINFNIHYKNNTYKITCPMLGAYQAENITGCFAMANEFGIEKDKIIKAIANFNGLKRRLEKRTDASIKKSGVTVFDDIAHSPEKAISVLATLRSVYKGKIITVFEPNIGGRSRESAHKYNNAFKDSDIVIVPRLTKLKVKEDGEEAPMEGLELKDTIAKSRNNDNTLYIEEDSDLVQYLINNTKKGDVIAFLGSHGFRGMIEEAVEKL